MAAHPHPLLTEAEYLAIERQATFKSEYYRGEIFAMSGARRNHNAIISNLIGSLNGYLKGKPCMIFPSDLRLHIPETGLYTYPDAMIVCGKEEFVDEVFDTITNPTVIIEVLSESTEKYDRGDKFRFYRSIPSLKEYLLVNSEKVGIEKYAINDRGLWELSEAQTAFTSTASSIPSTCRTFTTR
jgi:Uma2 family endonuclease